MVFGDFSTVLEKPSGQVFVATPPASRDSLWPMERLIQVDERLHTLGEDAEGELYPLTTAQGIPVGRTGKVWKPSQPMPADPLGHSRRRRSRPPRHSAACRSFQSMVDRTARWAGELKPILGTLEEPCWSPASFRRKITGARHDADRPGAATAIASPIHLAQGTS